MAFAWDTTNIANFIISLILIVIIYGLLFFVLFKVSKRTFSFIFLGVSAGLFVLSYLFCLDIVCP